MPVHSRTLTPDWNHHILGYAMDLGVTNVVDYGCGVHAPILRLAKSCGLFAQGCERERFETSDRRCRSDMLRLVQCTINEYIPENAYLDTGPTLFWVYEGGVWPVQTCADTVSSLFNHSSAGDVVVIITSRYETIGVEDFDWIQSLSSRCTAEGCFGVEGESCDDQIEHQTAYFLRVK